MAVQESYLVECDPATAFDCAIKTLQTFLVDGKIRFNRRFMRVSASFSYRVSCDAIAGMKVLSASISPAENGHAWLRITCDHLPMQAYNKGNIIVTITEFLDRYTLILEKVLKERNA